MLTKSQNMSTQHSNDQLPIEYNAKNGYRKNTYEHEH